MEFYRHNCNLLSKNLAHPTFYGDKTGNLYIGVQLCSSKQMEAICCLVPKLQKETHRAFYVVTVNFNISIYYRVT